MNVWLFRICVKTDGAKTLWEILNVVAIKVEIVKESVTKSPKIFLEFVDFPNRS